MNGRKRCYSALTVTYFFTLNTLLASLPLGVVNKPYTGQVDVNNPARQKLTFSLEKDKGALPKGLTLTKDGHLRGKPQEPGDFKVTIDVAGSLGSKASREYVIHVDAPALSLTDGTPPPLDLQPQAGSAASSAAASVGAPATASAAASAGDAASGGGAPGATGATGAASLEIRGPLEPGQTQIWVNLPTPSGASGAAGAPGASGAAGAGGATGARGASGTPGGSGAPRASGGSGSTSRVSALVNGTAVNLKDSTGQITGSIVPSSTDPTQVSLTLETPLVAGDTVVVRLVSGSGMPQTASDVVADPLDLGRVRYYFTSGVVLSNTQGFQLQSSGSQAGVLLGLNADRSWLISNRNAFWKHIGLNTYFDARLTSVATQGATATTGSAGASGASGSSGAAGSTGTALGSFLQSQKAGTLQVGTYIPIITGEWNRGSTNYAFFVAPLGKAGFTTLTDQQAGPATTSAASNTTTTIPFGGQFYTSYSYGARLGLFQTFKNSNGDWDTSTAPQMVSYVDITTGKFGNFEAFRDLTIETTGASSTSGADQFLRFRPWRYSFEGLLKVPHSPFVIGFNANIGRGATPAADVNGVLHPYTQPRDDLRFLFGAQFDFTKLLKSIPTL